MTGSMYASIAGLKTHMQKLSVIGNNVANVNTQGYKTARTVFRDSVYRYYSSGSDGTSSVGGMNPSQLGYGSIIGSIDIDMSSSSYNPGNPMDCALVGDGFFLVGNKDLAATINPTSTDSFKALTLSRVGDFHFDDDGFLVDGMGNCVYGFVNVNTAEDEAAFAENTYLALDGNGFHTVNNQTVPNISDMLVPIRIPYWEKVEVPVDPEDTSDNPEMTSKYIIRYPTAGASGVMDVDEPLGNEDAEYEPLERAQLSSISIAANGAITGYVNGTDEYITIGYLAIGSVSNPNGVSHIGNSYYQCSGGAGDLRISMLNGVQNDLGIDYVNGTMLEGEDGTIPEDTDIPRGSEITSAGNTSMLVGFLEAPNVDLATEISELITTQRGYQANTRIITVTDSMLEELVNMKR